MIRNLNYFSCLFLALFCVTITFGQNELKKGTVAPKIDYQKTFPRKYKIPEGKPIILDFWATWCGPCVAGLLATNEFIGKYAVKIDYVAVTDETSKNIESFIAKKKLTHHFIVDTTGQTFKNFGVNGIPHAFLIDKNHVIQWSGYASMLTPEKIDEFLKSGTIAEKKIIQNEVKVVEAGNIPKLDLNLKIYEQEIPDCENGGEERFGADNFIFKWNYGRLKNIFVDLTNMQDRIIYKNWSSTQLEKRLSVEFSAKNVDVEKTRNFLLNSISTYYSIVSYKQLVDTTVWTLDVVDSMKLNQFKTIMTNKFSGSGAGKYSATKKYSGEFTCLNYIPSELAKMVQADFGVICECKIKQQDLGFDFFKVKCDDFNSIQKELLDKYGIRFTKGKKKIEFLVVERK